MLFLIMIILSKILSRNGVNNVFVDITNAISLGSFGWLCGCKQDHFLFILKLLKRFQRDFSVKALSMQLNNTEPIIGSVVPLCDQ